MAEHVGYLGNHYGNDEWGYREWRYDDPEWIITRREGGYSVNKPDYDSYNGGPSVFIPDKLVSILGDLLDGRKFDNF